MHPFNCVMLIGPTASGKTKLAAQIAASQQGAVLSFDSRQVYKELQLGCGKDLKEYCVNGIEVPHYLLDLCSVTEAFHIYDFVKHFIAAFHACENRHFLPVLCGGTGLYFDAVLKKHQHISIPNDATVREKAASLSDEALQTWLMSYPEALRRHADTSTRKRMIRALEVASFLTSNTPEVIPYPDLKPLIFGLDPPVKERNRRIHKRLYERVDEGMIEEVKMLLANGVPAAILKRLGLEYKYITEYLLGETGKEAMLASLETAIHQYAKRQMTWFRKMEREGFKIHWLNAENNTELQREEALQVMHAYRKA